MTKQVQKKIPSATHAVVEGISLQYLLYTKEDYLIKSSRADLKSLSPSCTDASR